MEIKSYSSRNIFIYFFKQPIYKQLVLGWKITEHLSGLKPLSPSNNKNYRLKKNGFLLHNKRKIAVKLKIYQNSVVSKELLRKF